MEIFVFRDVSGSSLAASTVYGKKWEEGNAYPVVVVPVLAVLVLIFVMIATKNKMNDGGFVEAMDIKLGLTGKGWFFLLLNMVTAFCGIKNALNLGEIQEKTNSNTENHTAELIDTQPPYWCAMCDTEGPYEGICPRCSPMPKKYFKL